MSLNESSNISEAENNSNSRNELSDVTFNEVPQSSENNNLHTSFSFLQNHLDNSHEEYHMNDQAVDAHSPDDYSCPITLEIMRDPVILAQSNQTYERQAILSALNNRPNVDPKTNKRFSGEALLIPNIALRGSIEQWAEGKFVAASSSRSSNTINEENVSNEPIARNVFFNKRNKILGGIFFVFVAVVVAVVMLTGNTLNSVDVPVDTINNTIISAASCVVSNPNWIGDGVCNGGNYFSKECDYDGFDCVPSMKLIGDDYGAMKKLWASSIVGPDGNIYCVPEGSRNVLKIEPSTQSTSLVGKDLGDAKAKYSGSVVGNDGFIYGMPLTRSILKFDPITESTETIAEHHPILSTDFKFRGGAKAMNGQIYLIPFLHQKVVKFNTSNIEDPLKEIGQNLGFACCKFFGGVLGSDGNVYAIPYNSERVLKISVSDDTSTYIGDKFEGGQKWRNGVLAKNGNIYASPSYARQILKINTTNGTIELVGPDLGDGADKYNSIVQGPDGYLYVMPFLSDKILIFDPILEIGTLVPLNIDIDSESDKWGSATVIADTIYGIPFNANQILALTPKPSLNDTSS